MAVETGDKAVVQPKELVGDTKAVAVTHQAGRDKPAAGDLAKADPARHGFASADQLLGQPARPGEVKVASAADGHSVYDYMNVKYGSPDKDNPGVKPDSPNLAPREENGKTVYSPLAMPGEPGSKAATTKDVDGKPDPQKDGSVFTKRSGELKDGMFSNTTYEYSQKVNKDGDLEWSTIKYNPPKSMTIKDDTGGSREMTVYAATTNWDTNRNRYVTVVSDEKGNPTVLSTDHTGRNTLPYGMVG